MTEQTKAEELAQWSDWFLSNVSNPDDFRWVHMREQADELRRLETLNAQLLEALEDHAAAQADRIDRLGETDARLHSVNVMLLEALQAAHEHLDMHTLEISHPRGAHMIRTAIEAAHGITG